MPKLFDKINVIYPKEGTDELFVQIGPVGDETNVLGWRPTLAAKPEQIAGLGRSECAALGLDVGDGHGGYLVKPGYFFVYRDEGEQTYRLHWDGVTVREVPTF